MKSIKASFEDEPTTMNFILAEMRERLEDLKEDSDVSRHHWIRVTDQRVADAIIRTYSDEINRKILSTCLVPHTLMDLLKTTGIPQSTGYKKILSLIEDRFLVYYDTIKRKNAKEAKRYVHAMRKLKIEISEEGNAKVVALFPERKHFDNFANHGK